MNNLEIGDLLIKSDEVGIVHRIDETSYGSIYNIYWTWKHGELCGVTKMPEQLLSQSFFTKFKHIKGKKLDKPKSIG